MTSESEGHDPLAPLTAEERRAWEYVNMAASAVMDLPEQHPMERGENATNFHRIQYWLISRPAFRHQDLEDVD